MIQEIVSLLSGFVNQDNPTLDLRQERLSQYFDMANKDYFKMWCGLPEQWQPGSPVSTRGWQVAEQNTEALKKFITPLTNYTVDNNGQLVYPSGFVHLSDIGYYNSDLGVFVEVEPIMHSQLFERLKNVITPPSLEFPVCVYYNTYLQFYPVGLQNISLSYLRLPVTPVYVTTEQNGVNVFDAVYSVDFEWADQYMPDILRLILGYMGISTKDGNVLNYAETVKTKGV